MLRHDGSFALPYNCESGYHIKQHPYAHEVFSERVLKLLFFFNDFPGVRLHDHQSYCQFVDPHHRSLSDHQTT